MKIPEGYNTVMPYLIVKDAAAFKAFMIEVFDAKEKVEIMRESSDVIMHAEITIGDSTIMFANCTDDFKSENAGMFIWVKDADVIFQKAMNLGASSVTPLSNQKYGRTCGIKDPFGNTWWVTSPIR
ncbi:VOC family protein [Fulvivirga maritima]|uniref:VOC family protein n=1 Tax=Fulvivirga maritima TaxID=2904247 RepID=UPI001F19ACE7|nr:VOC family protein [Fulvivirga maritima]UII26547.1 VOC family protein [Fulvivirga maritima]